MTNYTRAAASCIALGAVIGLAPLGSAQTRATTATLRKTELTLPTASSLPYDVFFKAIVVNRDSADASILNTRHNREIARVPIGNHPTYAAASPDGRYAYVAGTDPATSQTRITRVDFQTLGTIKVDFTGNGAVRELEMSPDGTSLVASTDNPPTLYFIDPGTLATIQIVAFSTASPIAEVTFDSDSQFCYATAERGIVTLDLRTKQVLYSSPLSAGAIYTDIETLDGVPDLVFATWALSFDVHRSFSPGSAALVPFPFAQDLVMFSFATEHFVAYGESGAGTLHMRHINSAFTASIPSSSIVLQSLRFNPRTFEVWSVQPDSILSPLNYDVFDIINLTHTASIRGDGPTQIGIPAFSHDYEFFYHPVAARNHVAVIHTERHQRIAPIAVGSGPVVIVMQGVTRTREAYQ